jgi:hypothetical protein
MTVTNGKLGRLMLYLPEINFARDYMSDLDKLFDEYEETSEKKQKELQEQRNRQDEESGLVKKNLKEVILPVVQEFSTNIKQRGYVVTIEERFGDQGYPSITFNFTPPLKNERSRHSSPSSLEFMQSRKTPGGIDLSLEINNVDGKSSSYTFNDKAKWDPMNINEASVRAQVLFFIESVLKAN